MIRLDIKALVDHSADWDKTPLDTYHGVPYGKREGTLAKNHFSVNRITPSYN